MQRLVLPFPFLDSGLIGKKTRPITQIERCDYPIWVIYPPPQVGNQLVNWTSVHLSIACPLACATSPHEPRAVAWHCDVVPVACAACSRHKTAARGNQRSQQLHRHQRPELQWRARPSAEQLNHNSSIKRRMTYHCQRPDQLLDQVSLAS